MTADSGQRTAERGALAPYAICNPLCHPEEQRDEGSAFEPFNHQRKKQILHLRLRMTTEKPEDRDNFEPGHRASNRLWATVNGLRAVLIPRGLRSSVIFR
jgi:hypothetical protein